MQLEITPQELRDRIGRGEQIVVLDVREPAEIAIAHLNGSVDIPMGYIPTQLPRIEGLSDTSELAVLCHHGVRSLSVTAWLRQQGIENCRSVAGGIDRWSLEIDSSIPRY